MWPEGRRLLGARFTKPSRAVKDRGITVYPSDVSGADPPWVWSNSATETQLPSGRSGQHTDRRCRDTAFLCVVGETRRRFSALAP